MPKGPRLEALLDERDHLRVKISLAEEDRQFDAVKLTEMRRRLLHVDHQIIEHWGSPDA